MRVRRRGRKIAVQALYELDLTNHAPTLVVGARIEDDEFPPDSAPFVHRLVFGVLEHKEHLDRLIQKYAPEWPIDQMAPIDRNILRMALFEFSVELAKIFGSDSAPRFVNGVLGSLAGENLPLPSGATQESLEK